MENSRFKFRAWDKTDKRMIVDKQDFIPLIVTNKSVFKLDPTSEKDRWIEIDKNRFELMQSTGLYDKNGVEIYSGDLILLGKDSNGIIVGKVVYNEKDFGVPCYCIEEQYGSYQPFFAKGDNPKIWFEVIGNIYENSNLLGDNIE